MSETLDPTTDLEYGRCERCYRAARRASSLPDRWQYRDPAEQAQLRAIHASAPLSTHLYSPPCKCSFRTCWDEYLCAECASKVEKPEYVEVLVAESADVAR